MAHRVLPAHRPHEQLRTEPAQQRQHTDKYVSCFSSGEAAVDISFRNPVLSKSADHFKVGIDDLTVNIGSLSMLEYGVNDVIFRIIRRGREALGGEEHPDFYMIDGPAGDLEKWRKAFSFRVDRVYNTLQEVLERFAEIGTAVSSYIRSEGLQNPGAGDIWNYEVAAGANANFLKINVTPNGQIRFMGNQAFWGNFVVEVPMAKYRQILFKTNDVSKQYISLHPVTGEVHAAFTYAGAFPDPVIPLKTNAFYPPFGAINDANALGLTYVGTGNLLNTLDRRVTLEVGCSLPLKNSPLIDHGVEAPDFVLGRYMVHKPYAISREQQEPGNYVSIAVHSESLGVQTLQGPRDRVVFHHLRPQQKINTLRLKLWARVRTYDEGTHTWGMKTIVCPVNVNDYWHVRLHFVEK